VALTLDARALAGATAGAPEPVLQRACAQLQAGRLLALPTETVYGLAADADAPEAVARIYAAKGRPADHPLIVHVGGSQPAHWQPALAHYTRACPDFALRLMAACWPGPLTLILPRRPGVASAAAGGQGSIGLRCPAHPVAQAVLQAALQVGIRGLAAPSANRFGRLSPTRAEHVAAEFAGLLSDDELLILDAGPCQVGIESTIIDCSRSQPVLLRPGVLPLQHPRGRRRPAAGRARRSGPTRLGHLERALRAAGPVAPAARARAADRARPARPRRTPPGDLQPQPAALRQRPRAARAHATAGQRLRARTVCGAARARPPWHAADLGRNPAGRPSLGRRA